MIDTSYAKTSEFRFNTSLFLNCLRNRLPLYLLILWYIFLKNKIILYNHFKKLNTVKILKSTISFITCSDNVCLSPSCLGSCTAFSFHGSLISNLGFPQPFLVLSVAILKNTS